MNLNMVLQKGWRVLWNYRALWLFGAVLALVGAYMLYPFPWFERENNGQWTNIKFSDNVTIWVPGADLTIDLTNQEGARIIVPDGASWREFRDLVDQLDRETSVNLWPILIEFTVILVVSLLIGILARYIAETAVIRMVNEAEETGRRLNAWDGLRRGWSFQAWRLFLLDLVIGVLAVLAFIVVFGLAVAPVLLAIGSHELILITAGVGTAGLLVLAILLWLAASVVLSLVLQPIRRACVLEDQSLLASIRQGVVLTRRHLKEVGPLWLFWMGIRLLWIPFGVLIFFVFLPALLLTVLAGAVLGGVPAGLSALFISLFLSGATPWIMGALVGLPIFMVVTFLPIVFLNGLVEIYMSCIWTLAYRDLRAMEDLVPAPAPAPQIPLTPAHGAAD